MCVFGFTVLVRISSPHKNSKTGNIWTSGDISLVPTRKKAVLGLGVRFRVRVRVRLRVKLAAWSFRLHWLCSIYDDTASAEVLCSAEKRRAVVKEVFKEISLC